MALACGLVAKFELDCHANAETGLKERVTFLMGPSQGCASSSKVSFSAVFSQITHDDLSL